MEQKNREEKSKREKIREEKESEERRCRCATRWESRETLCFSNDLCSRGSKSRLAKAAGAEPSGQMRDEKLHAIVARSTFPSENAQDTHQVPTTFGSCDVKKVHAVVARSTFPSEKAKNTSRSDHFWKLRCRKSARRCGAKHISKSTCTKQTSSGPLLEVAMSKKCTPLWSETHFEVKM